MTDSELAKILHLCDLIALKTNALKEKLTYYQDFRDREINSILALYCRELLILNRQIESINRVNK